MMSALRRLRNDQLSGLVLMVLGGVVGWENRAYPLGTLQEPGPGYTPFLVSVFLGVIGLLMSTTVVPSGSVVTKLSRKAKVTTAG